MIGGRGTPDLAPARALARHDTALVEALIDRLVTVQTEYLVRQLEGGADAVQIFESHAGALPDARGAEEASEETVNDVSESALPEAGERDALTRWSLQPIARMIAGVRARVPGARSSCSPAAPASTAMPGWCPRPPPTRSASMVGGSQGPLRRRVPATTVTQGNVHPRP